MRSIEFLVVVMSLVAPLALASEVVPAWRLVQMFVKQAHEPGTAFGKGAIDYARIVEADETMTPARVVDLFKSIDPAEMEMAKRTDESLVIELRVPRMTFRFEKRDSKVPDGPPWSYVLVGIEDHRRDPAFLPPGDPVAERVKMERLAVQWYGEGSTVEGAKPCQAVRITAQRYASDGEMRWLVLLHGKTIGSPYNAGVVPLAVDSDSNYSVTMSNDAVQALQAIPKRTVVNGVAPEKRLNDLVLPYLLHTGGENSPEWKQGTYYYSPPEMITEYSIKLKPSDPDSDYHALDAAAYVDANGSVIHYKVTGVLTLSRDRNSSDAEQAK